MRMKHRVSPKQKMKELIECILIVVGMFAVIAIIVICNSK